MKFNTAYIGLIVSIAMSILFSIFFPFTDDPVQTPHTFSTVDNREHRLGSLSYAHTAKLIQHFKNLSKHPSPEQRADAIVQLTRIYRRRTMIPESLHWLKLGLKKFPTDPRIQKEKQIMETIVRRNQ